jgi:hypothetical protein
VKVKGSGLTLVYTVVSALEMMSVGAVVSNVKVITFDARLPLVASSVATPARTWYEHGDDSTPLAPR